jgi:hypothetical protein
MSFMWKHVAEFHESALSIYTISFIKLQYTELKIVLNACIYITTNKARKVIFSVPCTLLFFSNFIVNNFSSFKFLLFIFQTLLSFLYFESVKKSLNTYKIFQTLLSLNNREN